MKMWDSLRIAAPWLVLVCIGLETSARLSAQEQTRIDEEEANPHALITEFLEGDEGATERAKVGLLELGKKAVPALEERLAEELDAGSAAELNALVAEITWPAIDIIRDNLSRRFGERLTVFGGLNRRLGTQDTLFKEVFPGHRFLCAGIKYETVFEYRTFALREFQTDYREIGMIGTGEAHLLKVVAQLAQEERIVVDSEAVVSDLGKIANLVVGRYGTLRCGTGVTFRERTEPYEGGWRFVGEYAYSWPATEESKWLFQWGWDFKTDADHQVVSLHKMMRP